MPLFYSSSIAFTAVQTNQQLDSICSLQSLLIFHFDILKLKRKVKVHAKGRHLQLLVTKVADYLSNKITQAALIRNLALLGL